MVNRCPKARCRTCGEETDGASETCGAVPCVRIDHVANVVCEQWRNGLDDSFRRFCIEAIRGEVRP